MEEKMAQFKDIELVIPPLWCCTDNAAMIGASGQVAYNHGERADFDCSADPSLPMPGEI